MGELATLSKEQIDIIVDALVFYDYAIVTKNTKQQIYDIIEILNPEYYRRDGFYREGFYRGELPTDGSCVRCGAVPRNEHTGLCATCTDEDYELRMRDELR